MITKLPFSFWKDADEMRVCHSKKSVAHKTRSIHVMEVMGMRHTLKKRFTYVADSPADRENAIDKAKKYLASLGYNELGY